MAGTSVYIVLIRFKALAANLACHPLQIWSLPKISWYHNVANEAAISASIFYLQPIIKAKTLHV